MSSEEWAAHDVRHRELISKWGKPESVNTVEALQALGLLDEVRSGGMDPGFLVAYRYPSMEAAEAFDASNAENWGHKPLGNVVTENGVIGVTHLRREHSQIKAGE
jgi:hypothetical protein